MGILDFFTVLDWITPTVAEIQDHAKGPIASFSFSEIGIGSQGLSAVDVQRLLRKKGVDSWGWICTPVGDEICFTVKKKDAKKVQRACAKERISVWQ